MKKLIKLTVIIFLIFNFQSCSKSDEKIDDKVETKEELLSEHGTWKLTDFKPVNIIVDAPHKPGDVTEEEVIAAFHESWDKFQVEYSFNLDMTGTYSRNSEGGKDVMEFTWEVVDKKDLLITFKKGSLQYFKDFFISKDRLEVPFTDIDFNGTSSHGDINFIYTH